jgi:hypothetical protein
MPTDEGTQVINERTEQVVTRVPESLLAQARRHAEPGMPTSGLVRFALALLAGMSRDQAASLARLPRTNYRFRNRDNDQDVIAS